jgi:hypothetical protein
MRCLCRGRRKMMVEKMKPQKHFVSIGGALSLRKCLIKFYVSDNMLAALRNFENEVYGVKQKVKKQEHTLIDMCRK